MTQFYRFTKDGRCRYMARFLSHLVPKYLQGPSGPSDLPYYLNLEWLAVRPEAQRAIAQYLDHFQIRYVRRSQDLPSGAGLLIMSYDAPPADTARLRAAGVPLLDRTCPWMSRKLKRELAAVSPERRCVLLIERDHILFHNYAELLPPQTLVVDSHTYPEVLAELPASQPVHFIAYATYRRQDAQAVIDYIQRERPHPDHRFYLDSLCGWSTAQGLFEEIQTEIPRQQLDEVWIITNDRANRSVVSLSQEVREHNCRVHFITTEAQIPQPDAAPARVGILLAPVPYHHETTLLGAIATLYPNQGVAG